MRYQQFRDGSRLCCGNDIDTPFLRFQIALIGIDVVDVERRIRLAAFSSGGAACEAWESDLGWFSFHHGHNDPREDGWAFVAADRFNSEASARVRDLWEKFRLRQSANSRNRN